MDGRPLSIPPPRRGPSRPLTEEELSGLTTAAAVLTPGSAAVPGPGDLPGFRSALEAALAARADSFEVVVEFGAAVADLDPAAAEALLREMAAADAARFATVANVLAGAYLLCPEVMQGIGYPGQVRRFPPFDEAAEQILSGILDPVIDRGHVFVDPGASEKGSR